MSVVPVTHTLPIVAKKDRSANGYSRLIFEKLIECGLQPISCSSQVVPLYRLACSIRPAGNVLSDEGYC